MIKERAQIGNIHHEIGQLEGIIEKLIDKLPEDEKTSWEERASDCSENLACLKALRTNIANRLDELNKDKAGSAGIVESFDRRLGQGMIVNQLSETEKEIVMKIHRDFLDGESGTIAGTGRTAKAYCIGKTCFKLIYNFEEYSRHLGIDQEMNMAEELLGLDVRGVRIPKMKAFYVDKENAVAILVMERIIGKTLEQAMKDEDLPENFDIDDFFSSLEEFILAMHEKGVYHRDLHDGNIMIDWATGKPVIIDFGLSTFFLDSGESKGPYIEKNDMTGKAKEYLDDLQTLTIHRRNVQAIISKKNS